MPPSIDRRPGNGQVSGNGKALGIDHYHFKPVVGSLNGNGEVLPRIESEIRRERIWNNLGALYPDKTPAERAAIQREIYDVIYRRRDEFRRQEYPPKSSDFTEKDAYIITYPDSVSTKGEPTLNTFERLLTGQDLRDLQDPRDPKIISLDTVFSGVQLLPHQVASDLDRGFSQKDPYEVEPRFGTWENVKRLAKNGIRVTVDQLVNHASTAGKWFQKGEIEGDPEYQDLFESYREDDPPHKDFENNFFPRAHEVWRKIRTWRGPRWFRHTFGDKGTTDQVDFNYQNYKTLVKQVDLALFNTVNGADGVRLDSMPFTVKKRGGPDQPGGGPGVYEPGVKNIMQIIRDAVDEVNPAVRLLSENNVPQKQNIESLGKEGDPLSHIVYDFGETVMGYHALVTEQVDDLITWMLEQPQLPEGTSKINHVSCHDGMFLQEAYRYFREKDKQAGVSEKEWGKAEMQKIFDAVKAHGGELATRATQEGEAVYELDGTIRSLVSKENEPPEIARRKHLLLYATAWAIQGVPAVFLPSLVGKRNDVEKHKQTKQPRDLLRVDMDYDELVKALNDRSSEERQTYDAMMELLKIRTSHPAFSPSAPQEILTSDVLSETVNGQRDLSKKRIFGVRRTSDDGDMLALHNFSGDTVKVTYGGNTYELEPYEYKWKEIPTRPKNGEVVELFKAGLQSESAIPLPAAA